MAAIGILGGTFDPVHCGHLRLAVEMLERLDLDAVRLVPAPRPRLRDTPLASTAQRLEMLRLAVSGAEKLEIDERELARSGPTYTVETLESLRTELPEVSLYLILGMDAFARLDGWHRWPDLLALAHIAVARRPGAGVPVEGAVAGLLEAHEEDERDTVGARPGGGIFVTDIPALDISATRIRSLLAEGRSIRYLVPDGVHDYLQRSNIYRDAS